MQRTIWGYNRAGALGNTIFASTLLINKSGAPIDSMFMVQWADPDLGDAGDDFAGCDTTRSLGFIYNGGATDAPYGVAVPAGGFDFFQGPIVPVAWRLRDLPAAIPARVQEPADDDVRLLLAGIRGSYADPAQGPNGDVQWYRLMNVDDRPCRCAVRRSEHQPDDPVLPLWRSGQSNRRERGMG